MNPIEHAWAEIGADGSPGGGLRVDEAHQADFFAVVDDTGRVGLALFLENRPPAPPRLEAIEAVVGERADRQWALTLWLESPLLRAPFGQLCEDLVESSRTVLKADIGPFVVGRLRRWHDLLEMASGMSLAKLRGLVAELVVLHAALKRFGPSDSVLGWVGPWQSPQDFTLPGMWIEVKAVIPAARTVRITSADQLAAAGPLFLAILTLSSLLPDEAGISAASTLEEIIERLPEGRAGELNLELSRRLSALSFDAGADYARLPFRVENVSFYAVDDGFPRVTPEDLDAGIAEIRYDLDLGALAPFRVASPLER